MPRRSLLFSIESQGRALTKRIKEGEADRVKKYPRLYETLEALV